MSIRNYTFTFLVLIWIATGGAQTIQTSNTTEAISINDPRPVAKALEVLEERHGLAVNYEDPEYTHSSNTQDVTAAVRKPLTGTTGQRVIIPRGGSLLFQYIVNNNQPLESTTALLGRLLTEHASRGGAEFDLRQRQTKNGIKLDVVPNRVKNAAGEFVENTPLLDYRITVPKQERSGMGVLSAICQELTQLSGHHVVVGVVPANPLLNYREEFQAVDEPARDAVTRHGLAIVLRPRHAGF